jgi:hypothetical protein
MQNSTLNLKQTYNNQSNKNIIKISFKSEWENVLYLKGEMKN